MGFLCYPLRRLARILFRELLGLMPLADVFFVAFKIPNFFRRLFAEGAFAQAFVPILAEYREQGSRAAVRELAVGSVVRWNYAAFGDSFCIVVRPLLQFLH